MNLYLSRLASITFITLYPSILLKHDKTQQRSHVPSIHRVGTSPTLTGKPPALSFTTAGALSIVGPHAAFGCPRHASEELHGVGQKGVNHLQSLGIQSYRTSEGTWTLQTYIAVSPITC